MTKEIFRFYPPKYPAPSWLPKWKVKANYPDPKYADYHQFAWEFLRRNPEYQLDFDSLALLCDKEKLTDVYRQRLGFHYAMIDDKPYSPIFHKELQDKLNRWMLNPIFFDPSLRGTYSRSKDPEAVPNLFRDKGAPRKDPRIFPKKMRNTDDISISISRTGYFMPSSRIEYIVQHHQVEKRNETSSGEQKSIKEHFIDERHKTKFRRNLKDVQYPIEVDRNKYSQDGAIVPTKYEYPWLFDISLPLMPQLEAARKELEYYQYNEFNQLISASKYGNKTDQLINYLRIIDADFRYENDKKISDVLFSSKDKFKTMVTSDNHCNPRRDSLKEARKACHHR